MQPLRAFLQQELGGDSRCIPLDTVIRECYRTLLLSARDAHTANPGAGSFQERLHAVAAQYVRGVRGTLKR